MINILFEKHFIFMLTSLSLFTTIYIVLHHMIMIWFHWINACFADNAAFCILHFLDFKHKCTRTCCYFDCTLSNQRSNVNTAITTLKESSCVATWSTRSCIIVCKPYNKPVFQHNTILRPCLWESNKSHPGGVWQTLRSRVAWTLRQIYLLCC